jgi:S-adenosylmethionine:tRNA-ribosyltransferase-isomerase (queuine synthetase)
LKDINLLFFDFLFSLGILNMEEIEENENVQNEPLTKQKGRPKKAIKSIEISDVIPVKKERTEKQKEAFAKAQETVKANRLKKLEDKKVEASKLLLEKGIKLPAKIEPPVVEEEEPENEIIYVKKQRAKPKPKKKKIIVYQDESSEESSEEEQEIHFKKSKNFKTQQNKKSVIKVNEHPQETQIPDNKRNYPEKKISFFCD